MIVGMKYRTVLISFLAGLLVLATAWGVESGRFRILSVSESTKLILISKIPDKTKYLLDATAAKITVDGKAAELAELQNFSIATVEFELRKSKKAGVDIDGVANVIAVKLETTADTPSSAKPPR